MGQSVAIIIVNWNSFDVTSQCLFSLRDVTYADVEIVVVDNGSDDGSGDKLKEEYPEIILLKNEVNTGFTGGNNTGIQYAIDHDFDSVMLLNNDTIVTAGFIQPLVSSLFGDSSIGAIQPKIMYNYDRSIIWNAGGIFKSSTCTPKTIGEGEKDSGQFDGSCQTEWITGCCFLVKTELLKIIGLLDQKFFIYYEDLDWSLKLRDLGYKMFYEPESIIYHEAGMSDANRDKHGEGNVSPFSRYQEMRNHLFIVRRYAKGFNKVSSWIFQLFKFSGYLGYYLVKGRFKKFRFVSRAFAHGLVR